MKLIYMNSLDCVKKESQELYIQVDKNDPWCDIGWQAMKGDMDKDHMDKDLIDYAIEVWRDPPLPFEEKQEEECEVCKKIKDTGKKCWWCGN